MARLRVPNTNKLRSCGSLLIYPVSIGISFYLSLWFFKCEFDFMLGISDVFIIIELLLNM